MYSILCTCRWGPMKCGSGIRNSFRAAWRISRASARRKKRRVLADYYLHQAAPLEIEQEYYILFGDHGSNSCGIRQEQLANLQTPLRDRKRIVNQIIDNYYEARAIGHLTDPEGQQPVMPILEACYDASARSVEANENRYSIGSIEDYLDDAAKPAEE